MYLKVFWDILKEASNKWVDDNVPQLAAALAFYTIFSLAPLLIVGIYIVGVIFGPQADHGELVIQIQALAGSEGAAVIRRLIAGGGNSFETNLPITVMVVAAMMIGATALFVELQMGLNRIWDVKIYATGFVIGVIKARLLSFVMIIGTGFLLLASVLASATIGAIGEPLLKVFPRLYFLLINIGTGMVSFLLITMLFAMIYKLLPDVKIAWHDVWAGAVTTAVLFSVGKYLIGLYLTKTGTGSAYGAAGTLAIFIFWIYYSAQVFYFGAELTRAYSRLRGVKPSSP